MRSNNLLIRKTSKQIWLYSTAIVCVALICFGAIITWIYKSTIFNATDHQLYEQVIMLEKSQEKEKYRINKTPGEIHPPGNKSTIILIYEGNTQVYSNPNPFFKDSEDMPITLQETIEIQAFESDGYHFRGIVYQSPFDYRIYKFAVNVDGLLQSVANLQQTLLFSSVGLVILASYLGYLLSKKVMRPIEKNYEEQVRFVQDASHEMRTPLAVLQGRLELIAKRQGDSVEDHLMSLSQMMTEIRNLEKLNSDLLQLSKMDLVTELDPVPSTLGIAFEDLSDYYQDLAEIQGKHFEFNLADPNLNITWDLPKVKRMIHILMENAFKYTQDEGHIRLSIQAKNGKIEIAVIDSGIGIKAEDLPFIYERFYRSPSVRATEIEGSGIGLSLLKAIAERMNATVEIQSEEQVGTTVKLILPQHQKNNASSKNRALLHNSATVHLDN